MSLMFRVGDFDYRKLMNVYDGGISMNRNVVETMAKTMHKTYLPIDDNRTPIGRLFDLLSVGTYVSAGLARGLVSDNDISVWDGVVGGLKAANPFGDGYRKGRHTYSKVLDDMGWQPESTGGKIARGVVGFLGDVFLDPTTYLTGGVSALVKGTGKAGVKATHQTAMASKMAKEMGIDMTGKVAKDLPEEVYKQVIKKFANNPNINKELVERLATKKATAVADDLAKIANGLTRESAEQIILKQASARGITLSADDLVRDADKLAKEYNRIIGLRDGARDLRWTLGGAPFGEKIFGKYADKGFTIAKAETLQALGEKTIAPYYAKMRNGIYGSKLGKLFSSKSTLYELSKTQPEAVYDFLKFTEYTRGLTKDVQLMKKVIYDKAKAMNLTKDETAQVIKMMEDKSLWGQVQQTVKFIDTQEAKAYRARVQEMYSKTQAQLDDLLEIKKSVEALQFAKETELLKANEVLDVLRQEYLDSLGNLKTNHIREQDKVRDLIKAYEDEIANLKREEDLFIKSGGKVDASPDKVLKQYDEYMKQLEDVKAYNEKRKSFMKTQKDVSPEIQNAQKALNDAIATGDLDEIQKAYQAIDALENAPKPTKLTMDMPEGVTQRQHTRTINQIKENGYVSYKDPKSAERFASKYKGWEETFVNGEYRFTPPHKEMHQAMKQQLANVIEDGALALRDAVPSTNKHAVIESISNYLYGRPDYISPTTWDSHINQVADMIRKGESKESIIMYIEKNADFFSGRAQIVYPFIAEQMKYGNGHRYSNWQEMYHDRIAPIGEKLKNKVPLTPADERLLMELQQLKLKRDAWLWKFRKAYTMDDVKNIIMEVKNKEMWDDYHDIKHMTHTTGHSAPLLEDQRRNRMMLEDYSSAKRKTGEFIDKGTSGKLITSTAKRKTGEFITSTEKFQAYDDLVRKMYLDNPKINPDKLSQAHIRWANSVTDEIEPLLTDFFKKDYASLSLKQKELLYNMAIQNANKRADGAKLVGGVGKTERQAILKETKRRAEQLRIDAFKDKVKEGSTIHFKLEDGFWRGVVQSIETTREGKPLLTIVKNDGTIAKGVEFSQLIGVKTDVKLLSAEEIIKMSNLTDEFVTKQNDLVKLIEDAKGQLKHLDVEYNTNYQSMLNDFTARADKVKHQIKDIEETMSLLNDALNIGELTKIDRLSKKVERLEKALANDDAYESFMRMWLGNKNVDDIISINSPNVAKLMLDADTPVSQRVVKIAEELRKDLMEIGLSETRIGKLKMEQFDAMMYNYLPHILTDEGRKLFSNVDEITKRFPQFGDDLGYGRVFNPYGKSRQIKRIPDGVGGWIENPNILELNEFFKREFGDVLKGKNVFQENIADIYLTRAMKNVDLIYDHNYMHTMMDTFGSTLKVGDEVAEGYKAVANYGQLREFVRERARTMANLQIEQMKQQGLKVVEGEFRQLFEKHILTTLDELGLPRQALDELGTPMVELTKEQIAKVQKVRPDLVKQINDAIVTKANQARQLQIAKDQSRFLQLYDKFTHFIKLNQTTVLPSFHARNKLSNTFNNWLEIGADATNMEFQKKAFQAVKNNGEVSGVLKITYPDGSIGSIEWSELYRVAREYDVINDGFFAKDIGAGAMSEGLFKKLPVGLDPTDTKNFKWYKKGAEVGGLIEGQDRLIHFASQVSRGMDFDDAAKSVTKHLFDYSDLTAFEQSVMKRIIPYYTWLRKNSALQLEMMLEQPKKYQYIAKVMHGIEGMVDEEDRINKAFVNDFAKDWVQTPLSVTNPEGRKEPVLLNPNLPFMDLGRIPDPFNIKGSIPEMFTQVNPLIKTPIEQLINRNVYFDSPIVREGQSQIGRRADHILSQLAPYTVGKGFVGKSGADLGLHTLNTISGIKMLSYDYEKYKAMKIQELLAKQKAMQGK